MSVSRNIDNRQVSDAFRIGYEIAREGGSEFDGYSFFAGANLSEYLNGFVTGQRLALRLAGGSEVKPLTEEAAMDADLDALRSGRMQPIVRLTPEQLEDIEFGRVGV